MRVLLTDRPVLRAGKKSGVGHYTWELASALRRAVGPGFVCSWWPSAWRRWRQNCQHWLTTQEARHAARTDQPGFGAWAGRHGLGALVAVLRKIGPGGFPYRVPVRRTGCTVYHEPNFIPLPLELPTVVSVHDLSAVLYPEWHPPARVAAFDRHFHKGLERASRLIAISEFGKGEIVKHLGWPADRVSVTYMGVRPGLRPVAGDELQAGLRALGLGPGYLLHVGTIEPRKNLPTLLRAYRALPAAIRERHPLVLAGGPGWNSGDLHEYLRTEGRGHNVRWIGYVPDDRVPALYSGARVLVFPTFYEGFGMPTVEMMACGGAVLASTAAAVAETVGGRAHLIDPRDEPGWRDALLRACTDDEWIAGLRDGATIHAARYTWEQCALDTIEAYRLATGHHAREERRAA